MTRVTVTVFGRNQDNSLQEDTMTQNFTCNDTTPQPGERGFQPGCGCCAGPVDDRCVCWMHQDISRGVRATQCSRHYNPRG